MWPVLGHEAIARLQQQQLPISATSTISNQDESRTMRSAETQTELLECSSSSSSSNSSGSGGEDDGVVGGASSEDAGSCVIEDDDGALEVTVDDHVENNDDDYEDDADSLGEESKLKSIKRLQCANLFNFNKLELLNERCSGGVGPQKLHHQISNSSRNLCEHEVHVAIDDDLTTTTTTGEGKRTLTAMMARTTVSGGGDDSGSGSVIFIQESPEVIL